MITTRLGGHRIRLTGLLAFLLFASLDFSLDPDEIIAATSCVEKLPLLTRDRRIRKSRMIPLA